MLAPTELPHSTQQARLLAVAETIEANVNAFDMRSWEYCIAGMCALHVTGERSVNSAEIAAEYLSLSPIEARKLFVPDEALLVNDDPRMKGMWPVDAKWAAATVRRYALTGVIDWATARPDCYKVPAESSSPALRVRMRVGSPMRFEPDENADFLPSYEFDLVPV